MIAILDVGYNDDAALAACVLIQDWADGVPQTTHTRMISPIADYVPGSFYLRELPCLEQVLRPLQAPPTCIVIDGFVWLDAYGKPGLGAHLYELFNKTIPVIGVAKSSFATASNASKVYRGTSQRPLFVTAAGYDLANAASAVQRMHGKHRLPTMLTLADQLSKGKAPSQ